MIQFSIFLLFFSKCSTFTFHDSNKPVISDYQGSYFGYSILLQKTTHHYTIVVGAPKGRTIINGTHHGGQVLRCSLGYNIRCHTLFEHGSIKNVWSINGDFMGATVDGEDHLEGYVMGCSPRAVVIKQQNVHSPYLYGSCLFNKGPENDSYLIGSEMFKGESPKSSRMFNGYLLYNYAYALFGFSIAFYDHGMVFSGAPRLKTSGGIVQLKLRNFERNNMQIRNQEVAVEPHQYFPQEDSNYLGYAVYVAKNDFSGETWFFAGSPRADPGTLQGKVTVYRLTQTKKFEEICTEWGKEFGAYFGSSIVAKDLNNDGVLDLVVGAPTTSGATYDEGRVYLYFGLSFDKQKRQHTIRTIFFQEQDIKLTGSNSPGARFGTSMSPIGDFDLDGFNDLAVSAPYENGGKGAVYIYRGTSKGLEYSQRLIGADDSQGFGLGLSRGNDADSNGHNDIAIGAYKSDQVFLTKSSAIIDYTAELSVPIKVIKETTTEFSIVLTVQFSPRSRLVQVEKVQFMVDIWLDYRAKMGVVSDKVVAVPFGGNGTLTHLVKLKPMKKDFSSFKIELYLDYLDSKTIVALGPKKLEKNIRYDIGCRDGNVCITGLVLNVTSARKSIVLGSDVTEFNLALEVSNDRQADPAYQSEFFIKTPGFILLKNSSCRFEVDGYVCPFRDKLGKGNYAKEIYTFLIQDLDLNLLLIWIDIKVQSAGKNGPQFSGLEQALVEIPIIVNSTSYMFGKSLPENVALLRTIDSEDFDVIHEFTIGKYGPSPLRLNLTLLVPLIKHNLDDLVLITEIKSSIEGNKVDLITCQESLIYIYLDNNEILDKLSSNSTIPVFCDGFNECKQYSCTGILKNSNQKVVIEVKMVFVAKLLAEQFKHELLTKNRIAYVPILLQQNALNVTDRMLVLSTFSIIFQEFFYMPLWMFLIACLMGITLLMAVVFVLYKCQFFKRKYKELVTEEKAEFEAEKRKSRLNENLGDTENLVPVDLSSCE